MEADGKLPVATPGASVQFLDAWLNHRTATT
jgi:hypothetical protein